MTNKLNDYNATPKTYCANLSHFLYYKKIPAIPPFLKDLLNNFFASIFNQVLFHARPIPKKVPLTSMKSL